MKSSFIASVLGCIVIGSNAFATPDASVLDDLKQVDQFDCHIEDRGDGRLRILSTITNSQSNRYVDLDLGDSEMKLELTAKGWTLTKRVDLGEKAIAPLLTKFLYGSEVTELKFESVQNRTAKLSVLFNTSTIGGSKTKFECTGSAGISLDKRATCPTCLSSK